MAFDEGLAQRIRAEIGQMSDLQEKRMFGGVAFMLRGNLACGVHGDELIIRVGPERYQEALTLPQTRPFDMTGRPMAGWVLVGQAGFQNEQELKEWIRRGIDFASSLPAK